MKEDTITYWSVKPYQFSDVNQESRKCLMCFTHSCDACRGDCFYLNEGYCLVWLLEIFGQGNNKTQLTSHCSLHNPSLLWMTSFFFSDVYEGFCTYVCTFHA